MKKILAVILSLSMVLCMMPGIAFAGTTADQGQTETVKEQLILDKITGITDKTYTGEAIEQIITIDGVQINGSNADYNISYNNNTDVGENTASITITPTAENSKFDATSSVTINFSIKKAKLSDCKVTIADQQIGKTLSKSDVKVTYRSHDVDGDQYEISAVDTKKGGNTVTLTATSDSNFEGSVNASYYGANILTDNDYEIVSPKTKPTVMYTGVPLTVSASYYSVKVKNSNPVKYLSTSDYTVSFEDNINAGDATVVITGKNGYSGTLRLQGAFEILRKDIEKYCSFSNIENQIQGQEGNIIVKDGTKELTLDTHYGIRSSGTGYITIYGIGNYGGEKTFAVKYGTSILSAEVKLSQTSYEYDGTCKQPAVSVKLGDKALVLNKDYKLVYENNLNANYVAKVKVIGIGDYAGTIERSFSINRKAFSSYNAAATLSGDTFTYTGKAIEPYVTVTCGGRTLRKDVDYSVTYSNNNRIGTASVIIYGKDNYTGSITKTFRIVGKDLSQVSGTLSQTSYNYDGLEKKPTVTLYDGTKKLTSGVDYTISYRNNKNAGTGEVIVTGKGNYGGTKTLTFRIIGKSQTVTTRYTRYTKTLKSASFNLQAGHDGDGTLVYKTSDPSVATVSANGTVTITGTGKATITVSTTGNVKYDPASKAVYVNVKPLKPVIKVTSPAKKQIKVMITKVTGATKYQVKYGANGVYYNKYIVHNENSYTKVYTKIKNRVSGKTYEVKVRAYKTMADGTKVWGDWTTVKKIKAK